MWRDVFLNNREAVLEMLTLEEHIDLIIPRGGEGLIRFVVAHSKIPVLKHYKGVCHVFVDQSADLEMAVSITKNSKCQRMGVCNAAESVLVHRAIAEIAVAGLDDVLLVLANHAISPLQTIDAGLGANGAFYQESMLLGLQLGSHGGSRILRWWCRGIHCLPSIAIYPARQTSCIGTVDMTALVCGMHSKYTLVYVNMAIY